MSDGILELWSCVFIEKFSLNFAISEEDAAQTAVQYGKICAVVYPLIKILSTGKKWKNFEVHIFPDFKEEKSRIKFYTKLRLRLGRILFWGFKLLIRFLVYFISQRSKRRIDEKHIQKQKGGAKI
jgi:hypothetical protein